MGSEEVSKLNIVANQAKWTIERITNEILSEERKLNEKDKTRFKYDDEIKRREKKNSDLKVRAKKIKIKITFYFKIRKLMSGKTQSMQKSTSLPPFELYILLK